MRAAPEAALFSSIEVSKAFYSAGHEFLVTFAADPGTPLRIWNAM